MSTFRRAESFDYSFTAFYSLCVSTNPAQMKSLKYLDNSIPSIPLTNRHWTCPWNDSFGAYISIGLRCEYCCAGLFPCEISRNRSPQIPERDERTIFGFLRLIWIKINLYPFVLLVVLTSFLALPRCVLRRGKLSQLTHCVQRPLWRCCPRRDRNNRQNLSVEFAEYPSVSGHRPQLLYCLN